MRKLAPLLVLGGLFGSLFVGCADFDLQERIEDLRILGVRAEPAEIQYAAAHVLLGPDARPPVLPTTSVDLDLEVLAFDPRGGPIEAQLQLCPQGNGACEEFDHAAFIARQPESTRADAAAAFTPVFESFELDTDVDASGRIPLSVTLPLKAGAIDALIPDAANGFPTPQFFPLNPRVGLNIENTSIPFFADEENQVRAVKREIAFKRLVVGIDFSDELLPPELRSAFGDILGFEFCEAEIPDDEFIDGAPADCFDPRPPNANPDLTGLQIVDPGELPTGITLGEPVDLAPAGAVLSVAAGDTIALNPVFPTGTRERYQVFKFLIEESTLDIENRLEDIVVSWYSTRGDLADPERDTLFGNTLAQVWTLPVEVESGERDTIVAVARDQRGGTAFATVTVEYR